MARTIWLAALPLLAVAACYPDEDPCTPGLVTCQCTAASECGPGLECRVDTCVDPIETPCTDGAGGCPCRTVGAACDGMLECQSGMCVDMTIVPPDDGPFMRSCSVVSPPVIPELPGGYAKYLHCSGIPIVSTLEVSDEALMLADETMGFMLVGLDDALSELRQKAHYYVLKPDTTRVGDLPGAWPAEVADFRAVFASEMRAGTSSVENLYCQDSPLGVRPLNELVHTFAFQLGFDGLAFSDEMFFLDLNDARGRARSAGIFMFETEQELPLGYFARIATIYWEVDAEPSLDAHTREELAVVDPTGFALVDRLLNDSLDVPGCVRRTTQTRYCENMLTVDGRDYPVVRIGAQCWMAQNLGTTQFADGNPIEQLAAVGDWMSGRPGYSRDPAAGTEDGLHYNFGAVQAPQGLCPEGYRVPTLDDTERLITYVTAEVGDGNIAPHLRSIGDWVGESELSRDTFDFRMLPSGFREPTGDFVNRGTQAYTWTSDTDGGTTATVRGLFHNHGAWTTREEPRLQGDTVRCMRDGGVP